MDRNTITGIALIAAIVLIFSLYQSKNTPVAQAPVNTETVDQSSGQALQNKATLSPVAAIDTITDDTLKVKKLADLYGSFSKSGVGTKEFYTMENDLVKVILTNKGGRIYSVELKQYKTHKKKPLVLFNGDSSVFNVRFATPQNKVISTQDLYFVPMTSDKQIVLSGTDSVRKFKLRLYAGENEYVEYEYSLAKGSYKVDFRINMVGVEKIIASDWNSFDMKWLIYVPQQEMGRKNEESYTSIYYKLDQEKAEEMSDATRDSAEQSLPNRLKWVAFKQQFFSSVLISGNCFEKGLIKSKLFKDKDTTFLGVFSTEMSVPFKKESNISIPMSFYFGPNHYNTLSQYGDDLVDLVKLGRNIIKWINRFVIIPIFNFLDNYIGNYGLIILILTIIIKLLLFPLTFKSYLSQAKMKVLKPQIDEINAKYPADKPMDRQQATMALYKKVGVSPLGGCLPMLLQLPILIAMFRFFPTSIELRQQGFLWATDLSTYDSIFEWQKQIPLLSSFYGNHISLFTILMTITTLITVKMNSQATSSASMPGMKTMTYIMPVMFMFMLNNFSAGLTYYYFLANLITIGQNEIFKLFVDEDKLLAQLNENKKKPATKSGFQARLEKMAKEKGYKLPK